MAGFNVSSRVVLVASAHRIDHMLVSCLINQSVCGPHNFSTTLTESGVCYTITPPSEIKGNNKSIIQFINRLELLLN